MTGPTPPGSTPTPQPPAAPAPVPVKLFLDAPAGQASTVQKTGDAVLRRTPPPAPGGFSAKTFFTHVEFMTLKPGDFRSWLADSVVVPTGVVDRPESPEAAKFHRAVFAWGMILTFRARGLPFLFHRELMRSVDRRGWFKMGDVDAPVSQRLERLQLTAQIGIELQLAKEDLAERIVRDPGSLQFMYDTLYWPSRVQDNEKRRGEFRITKRELGEYLRMRIDVRSTEARQDTLTSSYLDRLYEMLRDYLVDLSRPQLLLNRLERYALSDSAIESAKDFITRLHPGGAFSESDMPRQLWRGLASSIFPRALVTGIHSAAQSRPKRAAESRG